jgi:phosphatidylglycerol:prolipoprotein diacylglycerol transferase
MFPSFNLFSETIYTYPLIMGIAWGIAYQFLKFLNIKYNNNLRNLNTLYWGLFISSWIGAKLFFIITSSNIDKKAFLESSSFWMGGGFVFYGGLIFGVLYFLLFQKITKQKIQKFNIVIPSLLVGHAIGRIGCFMAGCCFGAKLHWHSEVERYPVQLLESLSLFALAYFCVKLIKSGKETISFYLISYSIIRFFLEFIRGDLIRGEFMGLSTSQLISVFIIVVLISIKLWHKKQIDTF